MKNQIPSLGGLRALSILFVFCGHLYGNGHIKNPALGYIGFVTDPALAVNIFFVISGFLIASLLLKEEERFGDVSLKNFYLRRVIRIFPAYYFLVAVYLVLEFGFHLFTLPSWSWITTLTFTKYLSPIFDWITAHFWSLSVEVHFYLLFPFIFKYFKKYRNQSLIFAVFLVCAVRLLIFLSVFDSHINNFAKRDVTMFQRGDGIAIGCLVALNYYKVLAMAQWLKKWLRYPVVISFLLIYLYRCYFYNFHLHLGSLYNFFGIGVTSTFANVGIAVILVCAIEFSGTIFYKLLNLRFMEYIGKLSYSLYLWQQLFIAEKPVYIVQRLPYNVFYVFGAALESYYLVERPFLNLRSKYNRQPKLAMSN